MRDIINGHSLCCTSSATLIRKWSHILRGLKTCFYVNNNISFNYYLKPLNIFKLITEFVGSFKRCGMGPLLVFVSPCFRENVVVTCKIGSFLCSSDNLLQKKRNRFLFWKSNFKMTLICKTDFLDLLFTFLVTREKLQKIPSAHISLTYVHVFCSPYWLFALPILKKKYEFIRYRFSLVWFLVLILIRAILEKSISNKMVSKFKLECLLLICICTNPKFIVICKPGT